MSTVVEVTQAVLQFFGEVLDKTGRVISVESDENGGWRVLVESVEESEYTRRLGRSDILGLYQVYVDNNLKIASYSRRSLRDRTAIEEVGA